MRDNVNQSNICISGVLGEEREKKPEDLFEGIMDVNFPNLGKETDIQI